jgi:hypothetical protein
MAFFGMWTLDKDVLLTGGGMAMLLTGNKVSALGMFAKGFLGLERRWREANPQVPDTIGARWEAAIRNYDSTHQHPTNRLLHKIGIPMIVAGTAGLLVHRRFRPTWALSAWSFSVGWALNFAGHGLFEKNAPAFAADPLSFVAGPMWDLQQVFGGRAPAKTPSPSRAEVLN